MKKQIAFLLALASVMVLGTACKTTKTTSTDVDTGIEQSTDTNKDTDSEKKEPTQEWLNLFDQLKNCTVNAFNDEERVNKVYKVIDGKVYEMEVTGALSEELDPSVMIWNVSEYYSEFTFDGGKYFADFVVGNDDWLVNVYVDDGKIISVEITKMVGMTSFTITDTFRITYDKIPE